jgi:hypothetical protein
VPLPLSPSPPASLPDSPASVPESTPVSPASVPESLPASPPPLDPWLPPVHRHGPRLKPSDAQTCAPWAPVVQTHATLAPGIQALGPPPPLDEVVASLQPPSTAPLFAWMLVVPPQPARATSASARRYDAEVLIEAVTPFKEPHRPRKATAQAGPRCGRYPQATRVTGARISPAISEARNYGKEFGKTTCEPEAAPSGKRGASCRTS